MDGDSGEGVRCLVLIDGGRRQGREVLEEQLESEGREERQGKEGRNGKDGGAEDGLGFAALGVRDAEMAGELQIDKGERGGHGD